MSAPEPAHDEQSPAAEAEGAGPVHSEEEDGLLKAAPGLFRIALSAWRHTAEWTVAVPLRAGSRLVRAASSGESESDLEAEVRAYLRRMLGVQEASGTPREGARARAKRMSPESSAEALRARGEELLRRSADVGIREDSHPAYMRILGELAPDEARILRLLAQNGAQPAVDVRGGIPLASKLVAPGLTMIGEGAGCRQLERLAAYLNNLYRLGLVWFSREPVEDRLRYQVLEAQPDVTEALARAGRFGRTVRRSIHLTPFGHDFCELCLPLEMAELDALGQTAAPPERSAGGSDGAAG